jgi:photosystem II stability/assembly factor-like uncharacterized protein
MNKMIGFSSAPWRVPKLRRLRTASIKASVLVLVSMLWATRAPCQPALERLSDIPGDLDIADRTPFRFVDGRRGFLIGGETLWETKDGGTRWSPLPVPGASGPITGLAESLSSGLLLIRQGHKMLLRKSFSSDWNALAMPISLSSEFQTAYFLSDGQTGWAAGREYRRTPAGTDPKQVPAPHWAIDVRGDAVYISTPAVYFTLDGGHTWERQALPPDLSGYFVQSLQFLDAKVGIATVEGRVIVTRDGGHNWHTVLIRRIRRQGGDPAPRAMDAFMLDANRIWVSYDDGALMRTVDGGSRWIDIIGPSGLPTPGNNSELIRFPDQVWFSSRLEGLCLHSILPNIYVTKDGGRDWSSLFPDHAVVAFAGLDRDHVWVIAGHALFRVKNLW